MTKELTTSIDIEASPQTVWQILTDFSAYGQWNPFIRSISGAAVQGSRLEAQIQPPGGQGMTFKPTVLVAEPEKEFRWLGRLLIPGLFDGEHRFQIEPLGDNRVRFIHGETFSGLLVPLLAKSLDTDVRTGFEAMNQALKARAEAGMGQ
ncbi:SRPBCC domain-containing protein [Leptolyngbya sp. KIOST-1]|uniref:SRPBCC domain-containing protein n=1 Tax=Leptolyngbya sp. KIOST-1 TaxID=1229172 RepID=UPI0005697817|nr:SRPBCC domain-containing protein [Leptolyngbya sp. KIOST-1]